MRKTAIGTALALPLVALTACADAPKVEIVSDTVACREPGRYIGWPSAVCLKDGSVLAVFSGNRLEHCCPSGVVQVVRSTDMGRTWSAPLTIGDTPIDDRDAGVVQLPDGEILMSWFTSVAYLQVPTWKAQEKRGMTELSEHFGRWCVRSRDGGRTWTRPEKMSIKGSTPHGPIVDRDGSLLNVGRYAPGLNGKDEALATNGTKTEICCERSRDGGRTWEMLCPKFPDTNNENARPGIFHEPHVAELADGTLVALIRYHGGDDFLRQSVSRDGGRAWSPMRKSAICAGPSAMHLLALPGGRLVATYSRRIGGKGEGEFVAFSDDAGKTWTASDACCIHRTVPGTAGGDIGYPATVRLKDGSFLSVFYEPERTGAKPVLMATRWNLL